MSFCRYFLRLTGAVVLAATFLSTTQASELRTAKDPVEGRYIVVLNEDVARIGNGRAQLPPVAAVARTMARTHGAQLKGSFAHVLRGFVVEANDDAIVDLLLDKRVAYVEEDGHIRLTATQANATWGLDRIDQRDLPLDGNYTYDTTAGNVHTYIIDTGVRASHNDFGGRVTSGYTAINDGRGSDDCNGHGTHVAGTVAGATWGVAKAAVIHPVRVLDCDGGGTTSGVIAGMDWVAANASNPAVANMSLGGGASSSIDSAVSNMRSNGVTVVVAAGNENQDACNTSPGRSADAITVGSTTNSDSRSSFSNWGSCVDIFAPGSSITSAWHTSNSATNTISGTSMAAPHVAGIAALYLADNSGASPTQVENAIYNNGTSGRLSGINTGSPNLLAYSLFDGSGGDDGDDGDSGATELSNGVALTNQSGAQGSETHYFIEVPDGAQDLEISIGGGSGDVDLYVRFGAEPTSSSYDCRPYRWGNDETCSFSNPAAGTWYVMLDGYESYSGVTLTASFEDSGGAPCSGCQHFTGSLSGSGDSDVQPDGTYYYSGAGNHQGWLSGPSNADFDLELYRWNGSGWSRVTRSISSDSEEFISYDGSSGYYYWRVLSYSGSGSYDFWMSVP